MPLKNKYHIHRAKLKQTWCSSHSSYLHSYSNHRKLNVIIIIVTFQSFSSFTVRCHGSNQGNALHRPGLRLMAWLVRSEPLKCLLDKHWTDLTNSLFSNSDLMVYFHRKESIYNSWICMGTLCNVLVMLHSHRLFRDILLLFVSGGCFKNLAGFATAVEIRIKPWKEVVGT